MHQRTPEKPLARTRSKGEGPPCNSATLQPQCPGAGTWGHRVKARAPWKDSSPSHAHTWPRQAVPLLLCGLGWMGSPGCLTDPGKAHMSETGKGVSRTEAQAWRGMGPWGRGLKGEPGGQSRAQLGPRQPALTLEPSFWRQVLAHQRVHRVGDLVPRTPLSYKEV